ncbi:hypothetical protein [uncultured Deinococcus sp.]|uniref:hypothetical protein n=1 Tax=uncultured Deinococcus sp. TaxID=158789 RepID=UPI0025888200|nr:hypothetical protein [uncultured Deinococcus sp.]
MADDGPAFTSALDFCYRTRRPLIVPGEGQYRVATPITLQPVNVILGQNGKNTAYYEEAFTMGSQVFQDCEWLFEGSRPGTPDNPYKCTVRMQDMAFVPHDNRRVDQFSLGANNPTVNGFHFVELAFSKLRRNFFRSYQKIISGTLTWLTLLEDNNFLDVRGSIVTDADLVPAFRACYDSTIRGGYANGSLYSANAVLFDLHYPSFMEWDGIFGDFAQSLIRARSGNGGNKIRNCKLDYMPRGVQLYETAGWHLHGNITGHNHQGFADRWQVPLNDPIWTQPWAGIYLWYQVSKVLLTGNQAIPESSTKNSAQVPVERPVERLISIDGSGFRDLHVATDNFVGHQDTTRVYGNIYPDPNYQNSGRNLDIPAAAWAGTDNITKH